MLDTYGVHGIHAFMALIILYNVTYINIDNIYTCTYTYIHTHTHTYILTSHISPKGIKKWMLFGGSWGSCLSLTYAVSTTNSQ